MVACAVALLCWAVWFLPDSWLAVLVYEREAIAAGEWWRLWTGHLTHYTLSQLIADSGLVALLGLVVQRFISPALLSLSIVIALPLMSLLLFWLLPELASYRGASGLAAMLWLLAGLQMILSARPGSTQFWLGVLFLMILAGKLIGEAFALFPAFSDLPAGVVVVWQVHLFGTVIGCAVCLLSARGAKA